MEDNPVGDSHGHHRSHRHSKNISELRGCDESKCVSTGGSEELFNGSFTCYGHDGDDNGIHPRMCADGYLPRVVPSGGTLLSTSGDKAVLLRYFTCCPPTQPIEGEATGVEGEDKVEAAAHHHCSDPIITTTTRAMDETETSEPGEDRNLQNDDRLLLLDRNTDTNTTTTTSMSLLCTGDSNLPYYRAMKSRRFYPHDGKNNDDDGNNNGDATDMAAAAVVVVESHICCDSVVLGGNNILEEPNGSNSSSSSNSVVASHDYLAETECVPYHNEFYAHSRIRNQYGLITTMECDFPSSGFSVPRRIHNNNNDGSSYFGYECCKPSPTSAAENAPLFVRDTTFALTIYPQIVVSSLAAVSALAIILGLTVPVLLQWIRKHKHKRRINRMTRHHGEQRSVGFRSRLSTTGSFRTTGRQGFHPEDGVSSRGLSAFPSRAFRNPVGSSSENPISSTTTTTSTTSKGCLELPEGSSELSHTNNDPTNNKNSPSVEFYLESLQRRRQNHQQQQQHAINNTKANRRYYRRRKFSSYNLYLVYLAIPDLLMNLYLLALYGSYAAGRFNPGLCGFIVVGSVNFGDGGCSSNYTDDLLLSVLYGYWTSNLYLNAIVAYEIYALLRDSKVFRKRPPPSIRKVTLQSTAVLVLSIAAAISNYLISRAVQKAPTGAETLEKVQTILLNALLMGIIPIVFFPTICGLIWKRGLMPSATTTTTSLIRSSSFRASTGASSSLSRSGGSGMDHNTNTARATARDRALRELAWYFFRIVAVFGGCWIPVAVLNAIGGTSRFAVTFLVLGVQQILSTVVSLTKSDVRKHVFGWCCRCGNGVGSSAMNRRRRRSGRDSYRFDDSSKGGGGSSRGMRVLDDASDHQNNNNNNNIADANPNQQSNNNTSTGSTTIHEEAIVVVEEETSPEPEEDSKLFSP